ncbi:MAG TPA: PQQ-binding-like beta-propeller repeat protein [Verrucomicrobiae bacterium]|nr:PQQ-binding-like beta-propeller repeat protein [Verrucomicrobiae bacterium]
MKIQCACGAKYSFDATPEMLQNPVQLVCQKCGADLSAPVNELIRQQFAGQAPAAPVPATDSPRLKIPHNKPQPAAATEDAGTAPWTEPCARHPRELAVDHCLVCGKPMCPQCMKLFGHVCSPMCRARADALGIRVPVFAGQSSVADARRWRLLGTVGGVIGAIVALALGFWFWYAWIGSVPHVAFSLKLDDRAYAGGSRLCETNQIVFLRGGTLARCDIKSGKEIWSQPIITKQQIADAVARENALAPTDQFGQRIPQNKIEEAVNRSLESGLQLHVSGQSIWVSTPEKLTRYDWNTGKVAQEIPMNGRTELVTRNGEFLLMGKGANGQALITQINAASGESHVEEIGQPGQSLVAASTSSNTGGQASAGLPLAPGAEGPMNPATVGEQAQNLSLPGRLALPAIIANESEQERIAEELKADDQTSPTPPPTPKPPPPVQNAAGQFTLLPSQYGYVEVSVRLLESRIVTRNAMNAPPATSALNGNLNSSSETAAINDTLNEMQRHRGGGTVKENESVYEVSLRRPDSTGTADWTGQVTGLPKLYPLKTVNVLAAGKTVIVFDKSNKKLWQAALTYNVASGNPVAGGESSTFGQGPCVERGDTLYVIDQAVLTAFDIANGNARWRLPSVGIVGLFFDDKGMLYVNTTTADPENIKYSRQIDITQKIEASLLKIDPQTGKTLWNAQPGGFISYLSGKYIYTIQSYDPGDLAGTPMGVLSPAYLKIRRISPADGHLLWEKDDDRAPLAVQFQNNSIALVFKKEVQVWKYVSF